MSSSEHAYMADEEERMKFNGTFPQNEDPLYYEADSTTLTASIFPDMFKKAGKNAPFSTRGRVVLPWYRNKYQNEVEVTNCTALTQQELNHVLFDLQDGTRYWSPNCYILKFIFWITILACIAACVGIFFLGLEIWIPILISIGIVLFAIIILVIVSKAYKNYLIAREFAFRRRIRKNNQRIFQAARTEMRVGSLGAWLEILYDTGVSQINARDNSVRDYTTGPRDIRNSNPRLSRNYTPY